MIEMKIGKFVIEHISNIQEYCEKNLDELNNLLDVEYSKSQIGFGVNYSFFILANKANNDRYWKDIYKINNNEYRVCSQFGGSTKDELGKTRSQKEGERFIEYLISKGLLLNKYKDKEIKFVVGTYNKSLGSVVESTVNNTNSIRQSKKSNLHIKNIILYGAPGVGKTHNYRKLISMIENGDSQSEIFETITKNEKVDLENDVFKTIKDEKRVEFVTFHQSYSYEDFIEGFRPQENGNIELEDGIFKNLSLNASNSMSEVSDKHIAFDEAFSLLRTQYYDNDLQSLYTVRNNEISIKNFQEKFIQVRTVDAKNWQYIKKNDLETVTNGIKNKTVTKPADIKRLNVKKDTISLAGYYFPIANKIIEIMSSHTVESLEQKNFYIVIDEINRGNISKIFGELITLIEEDKRDKYDVTLPYSKESFRVPSNLYIIATMNSTDKSIATIDIALRRRFTFLKMKPKLELVQDSSARALMEKLNIYIKDKLNEDYMLGHSYFMGEDIDLEFIKEYKIKPLLEEYFYSEDKTADEILQEVENHVN